MSLKNHPADISGIAIADYNGRRITKMNKIWYLQKMDILQDLSSEELKSMQDFFQHKYYYKKYQIYSPEDDSDRIYLLHTGRVKLTKISPDGREITIGIVNPNEVFGEMALVDSAPRNNFAIAMEDSLLTSITKGDLKRIIMQKPLVGLRIAKIIGNRRREAEQKLEDMVFKDVPSRLANLILDFYKKNRNLNNGKNGEKKIIDIRLIHNDIANLIGSTRETTSANLSQFKREGLIDFENHKIVVLDEKKLERISQGMN